ncbi:MAG: hypothetical protein ACRES7_05785 [Gammaproteobacteria bacterium]
MRTFIVFATVVLLAGCTSTPSGPRKIPAAPVPNKTAQTFPQALHNTTPIPLTPNEIWHGQIDTSNPTMELFGSSVYYAIFALPSGRPAILHLKSLAHNGGVATVSIIPPVAILLDADGNPVGNAPPFKYYEWGVWKHYGANMHSSDIPKSAKYILFAADPRVMRDDKLGNTDVTTPVGAYPAMIPMVIPVSNTFGITGPIWVRYELTQKGAL